MAEVERQRQEMANRLAEDEEFQVAVADVLDKKHRLRWRLLTLWIIAFTAVGFGLYLANRHRSTENKKAVTALCFQREDLDKRIKVANDLLADNPDEKNIFGIPRKVIRASLSRDQVTRTNLSLLDCTDLPQHPPKEKVKQ